MIIAMAFFMGGFAMFTPGLMEWKKGNTYGMAPIPRTVCSGSRIQRFSFCRCSGSQKILVVLVQWLHISLSGVSLR